MFLLWPLSITKINHKHTPGSFCALGMTWTAIAPRKKNVCPSFCSHSVFNCWHFPLEQKKKMIFFYEQRCSSNEAQRLNDFIMTVVRLFIPCDTFYSYSCTCDTHTFDANASAIFINAFSSTNFYSVVRYCRQEYFVFFPFQMIFNVRKWFFSDISRQLTTVTFAFV